MGLFENKYYMVSVKDITKAIWKENEYNNTFSERVPASNFFLENAIPEEFQKIVLIVPFKKRLTHRMKSDAVTKMNAYFAEELIFGYSFCRIPSDTNTSIIRLTNTLISGYGELVSIDLSDKTVPFSEVKEFYLKLRAKHLVDGYVGALTQLFNENVFSEDNIKYYKSVLQSGDVKKFVR